MDACYQDIIANLEEKIHLLLQNYEESKQRNQFLEKKIEKQKEELIEVRNSFSELKSQYDKLKIAKTLSLSDDEKKIAHRQLSILVRNVNDCIKLINNNE